MGNNVDAPQATCAWCGHVLAPAEEVCPGCGNRNPVFSRRARVAEQAAERRAARAQARGGARESSEGMKGALTDGCLEGCVEVVGGMLFGMFALATTIAVVRRHVRR